MRAKFSHQMDPVMIITDGSTSYVQLFLNGTTGEETDDQGNKVIFYEYDFNEFHDATENLKVSDIEANPQNYLNYKPQHLSVLEQRLQDLESASMELANMIGGTN